jgi:hypothetical protein
LHRYLVMFAEAVQSLSGADIGCQCNIFIFLLLLPNLG